MAGFDTRNFGFLLAVACCLLLPLEISHLVSVLIGAIGYMLLQALQAASVDGERSRPQEAKIGKFAKGRTTTPLPSQPRPKPASRPTGSARHSSAAALATKTEVRSVSVVPVQAPTFYAKGWDAEVQELVEQLSPTPQGDLAVAQIAARVKCAISKIVPEAEVMGYASGNIVAGKAFGVAVPEVDVVINASPQVLLSRLNGRFSERCTTGKMDERKLHKSAIRACTDRLVSTGFFKFRRSAFRGDEPKVTVIATATIQGHEQGIPMNLCVNASIPTYNAALLAECGRMEPRAKELILLVRRWAKDRGLCHASRGHLSPYAWALLTIYYLQVAALEDGSPALPPLGGLKASASLAIRGPADGPRERPRPPAAGGQSVGALLRGFMRFYAVDFSWRDEAVSVRLGRRAPPDVSLPIHVVLGDDGTTEVGPSIENPFETSQNLGGCTTAASLRHLRRELLRADALCTGGASLTELLQPWAPTDEPSGCKVGDAEDE